MMRPPCRGCTDRTEACHVHCEKYKSFIEKVKSARELERKSKIGWQRGKGSVPKNNAVFKCHKK